MLQKTPPAEALANPELAASVAGLREFALPPTGHSNGLTANEERVLTFLKQRLRPSRHPNGKAKSAEGLLQTLQASLR